ncbi:MAG: hypothetical protein ACJAX5_002723 [Patiriisocius sp.]|jgi:hypothetical protein
MMGDLLVARPIGLVLLGLGAVTYVATLPWPQREDQRLADYPIWLANLPANQCLVDGRMNELADVAAITRNLSDQ